MANKIIVDEELRGLIPAYLENRHAELPRLAEYLARADFAALRNTGHQLAGSGGAYGFARVSELGRAVESAALAGKAAELEKLISELAGYLGDLELVYE